jgi:hypothetical protein
MSDTAIHATPQDYPAIRRAQHAAVAAVRPQAGQRRVSDSAGCRANMRSIEAYAVELLEPVLGGQWGWTYPMSSRTHRCHPRTKDDEPLISRYSRLLGGQPLTFSRKGRHPLGPSSAAIIGSEVDVFDEDGRVVRWVLAEATELAEVHGYASWARPDLVPWHAAGSLLLVAGGLDRVRAQQFGFTALAEAA